MNKAAEKSLLKAGILVLFKKEHNDVLGKLDSLDESINNLQYEGKVYFGKNSKAIEKNVNFLKKKLFYHIALDEKVIFPFLETHIPKLSPLLFFLRAERNEVKLSLDNFEKLFQKITAETDSFIRQRIILQLKEKGIYIVCLMRNHIQMEIESVYKPVDQQLHVEEKRLFFKECFKFMAGKSQKVCDS